MESCRKTQPKMIISTLVILILTIVSQIDCQNSCQFRNGQEFPANSWSYIENFSTRKCLRVENFGHFPDRKILLEDCAYSKSPLREQKIYIETSALGGHTLKVDPGMSEKFCVTTKNGILHNTECRSSSFEQNWRLKPVRGQPNQYLIMQSSSQKCLIPRTRSTGSPITLTSCNAFETEQIWKVCTSK